MKMAQMSRHWELSNQGQGHGMTEIFLHLPKYKLSSPISQHWDWA